MRKTVTNHQVVETLKVHVPLKLRKRGGRKVVVVPVDQNPKPAYRSQADHPLVKALARAHRWLALLESGQFCSISELAAAKRVDRSYVGKHLRLTLLAPTLTEAIVNLTLHDRLTVERLVDVASASWRNQIVGLRTTIARLTTDI